MFKSSLYLSNIDSKLVNAIGFIKLPFVIRVVLKLPGYYQIRIWRREKAVKVVIPSSKT